MAPGARIYLVEAASDSLADMLTAVAVANQCVAANGGGEVSMSWGLDEFSGETAFDVFFTQPGVVYFAGAITVGHASQLFAESAHCGPRIRTIVPSPSAVEAKTPDVTVTKNPYCVDQRLSLLVGRLHADTRRRTAPGFRLT
jgi:hypothetical protein